MSTRQPETPPQVLLRSVEAFSRTLRESSVGIARDVGCSRGTVSIIRILQHRGTLQVSDIAHVLRVDISVASRQVSQLVDDGLVERTVDDVDRRVRTIRLSPAGDALAVEIGAAFDRRADEIFADWADDELLTAITTLDRLTATVAGLVPAEVPTPA